VSSSTCRSVCLSSSSSIATKCSKSVTNISAEKRAGKTANRTSMPGSAPFFSGRASHRNSMCAHSNSKVPQGRICSRDIRWPNVLKDQLGWLLADFELTDRYNFRMTRLCLRICHQRFLPRKDLDTLLLAIYIVLES
jgi:hypothetical protein